MRNFGGFILIAIDAPRNVRYQRILSRNKSSDKKTWEGFLEMDNRDFGENIENGQQVGKCMEIADFKIVNDSSLEALYGQLDKILEKI